MIKIKLIKIIMTLAFVLSLRLQSTEVGKSFDKLFSDDIKLVQEAIAEGADINIQNNDGNTPLIWAAWRGYIEMAELCVN